MQPIAEDLAEAGVAAWNIEFKRWAPGEEGVWMDTLSDVLRAWGHLALIPGIDIMRSVVMSHSAGGHLALLMGAKGGTPKPMARIARPPSRTSSAPTAPNFRTRATPCADGLVRTPESRSGVAANRPVDLKPPNTSVLLFHGEHDVDVPLEQSETYACAS